MRGFTVRNMQREDLRHTYAWSIAQGWNIGRHDHDVFYAADPSGFFIGELDGEPIGSVSGVAYDDTFGFIGLYIVRPEYRGKGYGLKLFNAAMSYLGDRCVGLDGVIEQQGNYRKSGFELAYRNIRFGWEPPEGLPVSSHLVPAGSVPFEQLAEYDGLHFPTRRERFLEGWIREPDSTALAAVSAGSICGFGMIRRFDRGHCIGPLFADSSDAAEALFCALCAERPGETVYLDVPEINSAGVALARRHGMTQVFETARMYTGTAPTLPLHRIFGVTSFELG